MTPPETISEPTMPTVTGVPMPALDGDRQANAGENRMIARQWRGMTGVRPKVAVAGGSIGGLAAALDLLEKGYDVSIFEATDRLGGKLMTAQCGDKTIECGGEIVDTANKSMIALANKLGVKLIDREEEAMRHRPDLAAAGQSLETVYHVGGRHYFEKDFLDPETGQGAWQQLRARIAEDQKNLRDAQGNLTAEAKKIDAMSLEAYLDQYKDLAPAWVITALKGEYSSEVGNDADKLSALNFVDMVGTDPKEFALFGDSDEKYRVDGGMSHIIQRLTEEINKYGGPGGRVHFADMHELVAAKDLGGGRKELTFNDKRSGTNVTGTYDGVIAALPAWALSKVQGTAALGVPDEYKDALDTQYNRLIKITVLAKGRPWETDAQGNKRNFNGAVKGDGAYQTTWTNDGPDGTSTITFFASGDKAMGSPSQFLADAERDYAAALGKPVDEVFATPGKALSVRQWGKMGGCYVAPGKGQYSRLHALSKHIYENVAPGQTAFPVGNYIMCGDGYKSVGFADCSISSGMHAAQAMEQSLGVMREAGQQRGQAR